MLGPLLFLIYINDLLNSSKILTFISFADDANIYFESDDLIRLSKLLHGQILSNSICRISFCFRFIDSNVSFYTVRFNRNAFLVYLTKNGRRSYFSRNNNRFSV